MPMTYVISSHGAVNYSESTTTPPKFRILFYQNFGMSILNKTAFAIQTALCSPHKLDEGDKQIINANPPRTMWKSTSEKTIIYQNGITLTPDTSKDFRSGIVRALDNAVIWDIDIKGSMTLTEALEKIAIDAMGYSPDEIQVHCLFCT